jgi:RsmE family RNA methyltransferase
MNCLILNEKDFDNNDPCSNTVTISGERLLHLLTILKARKSDSLKIGLLNGNLGTGIIKSISDTTAILETSLTLNPPPPLPLLLLCSLPRPKTLAKVLQTGTSLGIKRFIFMNSWRVEKSYWSNSLVMEPEKIKHHCILGLEQACDTILPSVGFKKLFKPFIEDEAGDLIKNTLPLVAHPPAENSTHRNVSGEYVTLALGPEGGFIDYEVALMEKQGFLPVTLGKRIIRTEFALATIVGRLF